MNSGYFLSPILRTLCRCLAAFGGLTFGAFSAFEARALELPAGFVSERLADGIDSAVAMAVAPDGRILVVEQTGALRVFQNGAFLPEPALDLSARLDTYWERGLIGVALSPEFPRTGEIFVLYVAKTPNVHHVISCFTMTGNTVDPASEKILLEGDDQGKFGGEVPAGHQGGPLCFGADGKLYVGLGEQTDRRLSQSLTALQGKILRLNPDGSIPEDNPYYNKTTGKYRSIWAIGMRNPFGLAQQAETARLYASDVGESSWEEIDEILPGGNYGWPEAEGFSKDGRFHNPLHAYPPVIGRCISGGIFYPKQPTAAGAFPTEWRGKYLFADWSVGWIKALDPEAPQNNVTNLARGLENPVSLMVEPGGSLLVLNRGTIWRDGKNFKGRTGSLVRIRFDAVAAAKVSEFPATLAETGLFAKLTPLIPEARFTQFEINLPPWQSGVRSRRWIALPTGGHLSYSADGEWKFPKGAIVIQHFEIDSTGAPLETQIFWLTGPRTARAAAYHWGADGKGAAMTKDAAINPIPGVNGQTWFTPAAEAELNLDTLALGFALPVNARQINCTAPDTQSGQKQNQLAAWSERGWFDAALTPEQVAQAPKLARTDDVSTSTEDRVRSYLDVNCASCHRPGGLGRGVFDARLSTPLAAQNIIDGPLISGDLGIAGAKVVTPGSPQTSALFQRLNRTDNFRMPPVALGDAPQPILSALAQWIQDLPPTPAATAKADANPAESIRVSDTVLFTDMDCFRIETTSATYLFGKRGAGFASILDPAGHDWISYKPGGQSKGEYRGLPKCGHPVKYFHCGYGFGQYVNDNWFTSVLALQEPGHVRIHSETKNGDASGDWDIYPESATFTVYKSGGEGFWFIYEGTPDGELKPEEDYALRPGGRRTPLSEPWAERTPWVAIGANASPYALVMVNHQDDSPIDSYVSWPYNRDADGGLNEMAIFGFGRPGWTDPNQHHPQMHRFPARFSIALTRAAEAEKTAQRLRSEK